MWVVVVVLSVLMRLNVLICVCDIVCGGVFSGSMSVF